MLQNVLLERLYAQSTFEVAVSTILRDVVALQGAEYGDVQLLAHDKLLLVATFGLTAEFIKAFLRVRSADGCACGRALRSGQTVIIEDVNADPEYARFRADAKAAGYRSVQSTPLRTSGNQTIGIVSSLFANVHRPTEIEISAIDAYSRFSGEYLYGLLGKMDLVTKAELMHAELCAEFGIEKPRPAVAQGHEVASTATT
jgi:GAF domain-containing protein